MAGCASLVVGVVASCVALQDEVGKTDALANPCALLVERTCGGGLCEGSGWCAAARLLANDLHDDARCSNALMADAGYPTCEATPRTGEFTDGSSCYLLVDHVCGQEGIAGRPCGTTIACHEAMLLAAYIPATADADGGSGGRDLDAALAGDAGAEDGGAPPDVPTADQLCAAALGEPALYPRCTAR